MHRSPTSPLLVKIPKLLKPKSKNKHKPETNLSPRDNVFAVLVEEGPTLLPMALSTMTLLLKHHKETVPTVAAEEAVEENPLVVTSTLRRALKPKAKVLPKAKVEDVAAEDKEEVKEDKEDKEERNTHKDNRKVLRLRTKMLLDNKRQLIKYKTPNPKPLNNPLKDKIRAQRREANKIQAKNKLKLKDKINPPRLSPLRKRESKPKGKVNKRPRAKSKDNRLRDNKPKDKPKESKDNRPRDNKPRDKSKVSREALCKNKRNNPSQDRTRVLNNNINNNPSKTVPPVSKSWFNRMVKLSTLLPCPTKSTS